MFSNQVFRRPIEPKVFIRTDFMTHQADPVVETINGVCTIANGAHSKAQRVVAHAEIGQREKPFVSFVVAVVRREDEVSVGRQ